MDALVSHGLAAPRRSRGRGRRHQPASGRAPATRARRAADADPGQRDSRQRDRHALGRLSRLLRAARPRHRRRQRSSRRRASRRTATCASTVRVGPAAARALAAETLDIVTERLDGKPFDLVIATNILPYFDDGELMLAMSNIAAMLAPGGVFLHNEARPVLGDITTARRPAVRAVAPRRHRDRARRAGAALRQCLAASKGGDSARAAQRRTSPTRERARSGGPASIE